MKIDGLFNLLEKEDYDSFMEVWKKEGTKLSELEKQPLLTRIVDELYATDRFYHLKKVFDAIIGSKFNFNIDHYAPTFLSLVILRAPLFWNFRLFSAKRSQYQFHWRHYGFSW
jgi:hypothetical protein